MTQFIEVMTLSSICVYYFLCGTSSSKDVLIGTTRHNAKLKFEST